ncbi:MAG: dephospho-CoA kinase [Vicingaceae bacterium]|nr:dephospho-CoA kinase [Vicingaceae bacterium]
MLTIGLTGGIGSGKSTVAQIFETLGIPVFNSDIEAKKLLLFNDEVKKLVKAKFESAFENNQLNKTKLAQLVFNDKTALNQLNQIIHPAVKKIFLHWVEANKTAPFVIKEAAILIETELHKELDKLILVTAPTSLRIQRVIARDGITEQEVFERINNQLSDEKKIPFADFVIQNDDETLVIPQVMKIYDSLMITSI